MRPTALSPRSLLASPPRGWKDVAVKKDEVDPLSPVALKRKQFQSEKTQRKHQLGKLIEEPTEAVGMDAVSAEVRQEMSALAASLELEAMRARQRLLAAQEIISTEKTYVDQLLLLIKIYKQPLYHILGDGALCKKFPEEAELRILFSNVDAIHQFNAQLLEQLEARLTTWDEKNKATHLIGDIFTKMIPFLSIYNDYCSNYFDAIKLLSELEGSKPDFAEWVKDRVVRNTFQLLDLLILPVQRIPRYRMLLDALLKLTDADHADKVELESAVHQVEAMADKLNEHLKRIENRRRLVAIHERLTGNITIDGGLLQPHRRLLSEHSLNLLEKRCLEDESMSEMPSESDMPREVFEERRILGLLFNDSFAVAEVQSKKGEEPNASPLLWIDYISLYDSFLKKMPTKDLEKPFTFQYVNPRRTFTLRAASEEDKNKFKDAVQGAVKLLTFENPALAEKRRLVNVTRNSTLNIWEAIAVAPTFADRVSARQLEAETPVVTKKELEDLLVNNRDYFDNQPVFSPSKKDSKGLRGLLSHLSPQKKKKSALADDPVDAVKSPKKLKKFSSSDKIEDNHGVSSQSLQLTLEIQKWNSKIGSKSKGLSSPRGARSPTSPKTAKSPKSALSPKSPLSSKSPMMKRKANQIDVVEEKDEQETRGMKRLLEEDPCSPSFKRRRADNGQAMPMSPMSTSMTASKSDSNFAIKKNSSDDNLHAATAPELNLAENVILLQGQRNARNSAQFRNANLSQKIKAQTLVSPDKKTASPKPVFAIKENLLNGSPMSPSRRNTGLRAISQPNFTSQ